MTALAPSEIPDVTAEPVATESGRASLHTWRAFRREPLGIISLSVLAPARDHRDRRAADRAYPASYGTDVLVPPRRRSTGSAPTASAATSSTR